MHSILNGIADRYNLRRRTKRWEGQCPKCGGSAKTNKFSLYDSGGFKCYSCEWKGDIITWLREMEQMSCAQAHDAAGKECLSSTCGVYDSCRRGNGKKSASRARPLRPARTSTSAGLPRSEIQDPQERWLSWATDMHAKASERMAQNAEQHAWLARRGIDAAAVCRFRLGWLPHHQKVDRKSIGLEPREDGKKTLWVPDGLLIPTLNDNNTLHRLRVRRPSASREKFLPELKYLWLEGSGTAPMLIRQEGLFRGVVIVEAELDGMAVAAAHPDVVVVALGTVAGGLPPDMRKIAESAPVILVALDADPGDGKTTGAGPRAIASWRSAFRQARFWPVPEGKDPGHYAELGGDLHAWIEAGLPPAAKDKHHPQAPSHDQPVSPGQRPTGVGGGFNSTDAQSAFTINLPDGLVAYVVDSRQEWERLVDEGKVVFSRHEMERLHVATATMSPEEKQVAAMLVVETKRVFGNAWIRRGEAI